MQHIVIENVLCVDESWCNCLLGLVCMNVNEHECSVTVVFPKCITQNTKHFGAILVL